jgi:hypothetical protein
MNLEQSHILKPILDNLEANDQTLFYRLQQKVLGVITSTGQGIGTAAAAQAD